MTTANACLKLRELLELTQQSMAQRLGCAIRNIPNYEGSSYEPSTKMLYLYMRLAEESNMTTLEDFFRKRLRESLGESSDKQITI